MDAKSALRNKDKVLPGLRADEKVLAQTLISLGIYWKVVPIVIFAIILLFFAYQLTIFMLLVATLTFIFTYIKKTYLLLVVTNQRVLVKSGILLTDMISFQYTKIESVETQTTLLGRFLGYSSLAVSGTGSQFAFIPFVKNAAEIQQVINEILQRKDVSSNEYLEKQARIQAEALADALEEHQKEKP